MLLAGSATANDVALITQLSGPFVQLSEGERFSVAAGARVRVLYFQSGRLESYEGPATFTAGTHQSSVQSGASPQASTLPSGVPQKISQTPELLQIAKLGRSSGGAVRDQRLTPQQQAEVRQARETYGELRRSSTADDITPELYLYSVLQDHLLYKEMKGVVAEMQRRQPANPDVAVMVQYVRAKTKAR
jgi:hypothetical protein